MYHFVIKIVCKYERFQLQVIDEGEAPAGTSYYSGKSQEECERICEGREDCHSFAYEPLPFGKCFLKNKALNGDEPQTQNAANIYTVYRKCSKNYEGN